MNMNLEQPSAFVSSLRLEQSPSRIVDYSPDKEDDEDNLHEDGAGLANYYVVNMQPKDKYNFVYLSLVLAGIGFLLPYNSFVNAVDFYQERYDNHLIIFDISLTYIVVMLLSVVITNLLVTKIHLRWRISFGYLVSVIILFSTTIFDIILNVFPKKWSYALTLICAGVVSFGCTVQQSSFYGYTSMLPRRFTQAVMLGESAAGFIVSMNRLVTKGAVDNIQRSTAVFFILSSCLLMFCLVCFHLGVKTDFIRHYMTLAQSAHSNTNDGSSSARHNPLDLHVPSHDSDEAGEYHENPAFQAEMQDLTEPLPQTRDTDIVSPAKDSAEENVEIDLNSPEPTHQGFSALPDILYTAGHETSRRLQRVVGFNTNSNRSWLLTRDSGLKRRLKVANRIWTYMAAIACTYLVTLSLFPGIETEIPSCRLKTWMPVMLMAVFNAADLLGKTVAAIPVRWTGGSLLACSLARFLLIPIFMTSASPRKSPLIQSEVWSFLVTSVLGITNGYFGSIPMIMAPQNLQLSDKEIIGNLMTLCYSLGLTAGSGIAYWLDNLLGPLPPGLAPYEFTCGLYNSSQVYNQIINAGSITSLALN